MHCNTLVQNTTYSVLFKVTRRVNFTLWRIPLFDQGWVSLLGYCRGSTWNQFHSTSVSLLSKFSQYELNKHSAFRTGCRKHSVHISLKSKVTECRSHSWSNLAWDLGCTCCSYLFISELNACEAMCWILGRKGHFLFILNYIWLY